MFEEHDLLDVAAMVFALVFVAWVMLAPRALAYDEPPTNAAGPAYSNYCPPRPVDPPAGASDDLAALVTIEQELADLCKRREQLDRDDEAAADARAGEAHTDAQTIASAVAAAGPTGATGPSGEVTLAYPTRAQIDNAADRAVEAVNGLHGDLWVLAGVMVATFVGSVLVRHVMP